MNEPHGVIATDGNSKVWMLDCGCTHTTREGLTKSEYCAEHSPRMARLFGLSITVDSEETRFVPPSQ